YTTLFRSIGAPVRSKPPSEATPEPSPICSIGGMVPRGTLDPPGAQMLPLEYSPFPKPADGGAATVVAAVAKLAIGRALMSDWRIDRKSTRLNSSHVSISYAVFCLKKKKKKPLCRSLGL